MKITAITTGGTIASTVGADGYMRPVRGTVESLIKEYCSGVDINVSSPFSILSENLDTGYINKLTESVQRALADFPDGIIVFHGSDTIAWSTAALSYVFPDVPVPVVLVCSNLPLDNPSANGPVHLRAALKLISAGYPGVFVPVENEPGAVHIHYGTRLMEPLAFTHHMYSILGAEAGVYKESEEGVIEGELIWRDTGILRETCRSQFHEDTYGERPAFADMRDRLLLIHPTPLSPLPELKETAEAVLFDSYHSGTIRVNEELRDLCRRAEDSGIPVFLTGYDDAAGDYETEKEYQALGVIPLSRTAFISQSVKLALGISRGYDLRKYMSEDISRDHVPVER